MQLSFSMTFVLESCRSNVILLITTEYNLVSLKQARHNVDKHSCLGIHFCN